VGGVGKHYRGQLGTQYFAWQGRGGELSAQIERSKFERWTSSHDAVVDFGCGSGHLLELLPAGRRLGVEPNEAARLAAQERGLQVVASTSEIPERFADVVISNHALEHTIAPWDELCELRRVLKPGGRLVLWLPLDDWRTQRRTLKDDNHHLYTWTPLLLRNLLDEAGFEVDRVRVVTHAWPQFHERLFKALPRRGFDALASAWAFATRHRQLMAVASRPPATDKSAGGQPVLVEREGLLGDAAP
jgi:SAM-dependent methyltransferase